MGPTPSHNPRTPMNNILVFTELRNQAQDIVIMGSDGVFDNLYLDEIMEMANAMLVPGQGHFSEMQLKALLK